MELPTIMLCFEKPSSRSTEYEYGSNFTIHYEISDENYIHQGTLWLNEGENLVKEDSAWDKMPSLPKNNVIALVVKYEWYSCIFISPFETSVFSLTFASGNSILLVAQGVAMSNLFILVSLTSKFTKSDCTFSNEEARKNQTNHTI